MREFARAPGNADLATIAMLAGWATPTVSQAGGTAEKFLARKARTRACGVALTDLGLQVRTWRDVVWIDCDDGKRRPLPTQPALFPLADGVPGRMGKLRGAGNAIVPQVAAAFIQAALDAINQVTTPAPIARHRKEEGE